VRGLRVSVGRVARFVLVSMFVCPLPLSKVCKVFDLDTLALDLRCGLLSLLNLLASFWFSIAASSLAG